MNYLSDYIVDSKSYDDQTYSTLTGSFDNILSSDNIYTIIEILVVIILIVVIGYIVNKCYFNIKPDVGELIQIPNGNNKTIYESLEWCANNYPLFPALMIRKDNNWSYITYEEYYKNSFNFAKELNYWVGSKINVGIIGFNSPAWFYTYIGTLINSGVSVGISCTYDLETYEHIFDDSNIQVLVIEDGNFLIKLSTMNIPSIKLILYYSPISDDIVKKFSIPVVSFGAFMDSKEKKNITLNKYHTITDPATILYTSGTTNKPKGVIISHKNIVNMTNSIINTIKKSEISISISIQNGERFVSYLPLDHIGTQLMDIYIPILLISTIWFSDRDVLKPKNMMTVINTLLRDSRPTIMYSIPKIWDGIKSKIEEKYTSFITRNLPLMITKNKLVNDIGLNKCKLCISYSSPINDTVCTFFDSIGLRLYNVYGLTETTGPITMTLPGHYMEGSVGCPIEGTLVKIGSESEIMVKSNTVFKEYIENSKSSKKMFDNGWLKTGDCGHIKNGFLFITGRIKDLLITYDGDKIRPSHIENKLMNLLPEFQYVIVIGENKKYLSLLLIPKQYTEFQYLDESVKSIDDIISSKLIDDHISKILKNFKIDNCNVKIKKWLIISKEFTVGKELTSNFKIRRNYIETKYKNKIEKLYV